MFSKRVNKSQRKFTVPLAQGGPGLDTKNNRIELEVIIGKVEKRKWRVFKTYTQQKIVAIATGTLYKQDTRGSFWEKVRIGEMERNLVADTTWRDHSEVDIDDEEREAVVDAVRELSLDIYEDKTKVFGIDAHTVFTQIMLGFIVGGDVPPPHPVNDPYRGLRHDMKQDFFDNTNIDPNQKI